MGSDQPFHISDLSHVFFFFFFERGDILIFKINQNMHELKIGYNTSQIWLAPHSHGKGEIFFWWFMWDIKVATLQKKFITVISDCVL